VQSVAEIHTCRTGPKCRTKHTKSLVQEDTAQWCTAKCGKEQMQDDIRRKCSHHNILVQNKVPDRTLLYNIMRPATHYVVQQRSRPHIVVQQNMAIKQLRQVANMSVQQSVANVCGIA
jgi:hypothetical protein